MPPLAYATLDGVRDRLGLLDTDTDDNDLIQKYCNEINAAMEKKMGCQIGPSPDTVRYYDGYALRQGGNLFIRDGVRALTEVAVASQTGADYVVQDMDNILLRPLEQDREPDWPAQYLRFDDLGVNGWSLGYTNIRLTGVTLLAFGFEAIPDDLHDVGDTTVVRAWLSRRSGETDVMGVDENNQPVISRFISPYHANILKFYRNGTRRWYARRHD